MQSNQHVIGYSINKSTKLQFIMFRCAMDLLHVTIVLMRVIMALLIVLGVVMFFFLLLCVMFLFLFLFVVFIITFTTLHCWQCSGLWLVPKPCRRKWINTTWLHTSLQPNFLALYSYNMFVDTSGTSNLEALKWYVVSFENWTTILPSSNGASYLQHVTIKLKCR